MTTSTKYIKCGIFLESVGILYNMFNLLQFTDSIHGFVSVRVKNINGCGNNYESKGL